MIRCTATHMSTIMTMRMPMERGTATPIATAMLMRTLTPMAIMTI